MSRPVTSMTILTVLYPQNIVIYLQHYVLYKYTQSWLYFPGVTPGWTSFRK